MLPIVGDIIYAMVKKSPRVTICVSMVCVGVIGVAVIGVSEFLNEGGQLSKAMFGLADK